MAKIPRNIFYGYTLSNDESNVQPFENEALKPNKKKKKQEVESIEIPSKTQGKENIQNVKIEKSLEKMIREYGCGNNLLEKWVPIKLIGKGAQSSIIQVCELGNCDYVLKLADEKEKDFALKMGQTNLSPKIVDHFLCDINLFAIIGEKMDGDLSDFLYPPQPEKLDIIFPQVFNII